MTQPDPTALRDRIRRVLCERDGQAALWGTDMLEPDEYGETADAVLSVLPACSDPIECSHEAALGEAQQQARRLGLMVDEYGAGASALTDKLKRIRELHRETCPVAQGVILPPAAVCSLCGVLDAPAAAVLPASVDRADVLDRIRKVVRRLAAHAVGFQDVLDESDRGPWGKTVAADIAELRRMIDEDAPLSPFYEHPACGFWWHGRDDMDIPMRDGQPVCPRCELAAAEKRLRYS
jgi:hypothetical protein